MTMRDPEVMPSTYITGNGIAMASNRISHFYDFQGPSMTIDVGCSTGLVALHQACRNLQSGESDISIVGAAISLLSPDMFVALSSMGYVSSSASWLDIAFIDCNPVFWVPMANALLGTIGRPGMGEVKAVRRLFWSLLMPPCEMETTFMQSSVIRVWTRMAKHLLLLLHQWKRKWSLSRRCTAELDLILQTLVTSVS